MSFKKIGSRYDKDLKEWLEQFEAEYERDLSALPEANPGSTCYVKETGKTVVMGNNGVWGGGSAELPFGETTTVKEVLAECQPEFAADMGGFLVDQAISITVGEKYIVNWNGVDVECVCKNFFNGEVTVSVLGNIGAITGGEDTGEHFVVISYPADAETNTPTSAVPLDGSTTLTISIRQEVTEVKKISGKYVEGMIYSEKSVKEVLAECQPEFDTDMGGFLVDQAISLTFGGQYVVNWNGVDVECVCKKIDNENGTIFALGNLGAAIGGEDTGEPFAVLSYPYNGLDGPPTAAVPFDGSTTLTISILKKAPEVTKIDPKYLPDIRLKQNGSAIICDEYTAAEVVEILSNDPFTRLVLEIDKDGLHFYCVATTVTGADGAFSAMFIIQVDEGSTSAKIVMIDTSGFTAYDS